MEIGLTFVWLGGTFGITVYWMVVRLTGWRSFIPLAFAVIPFFAVFHMLRKNLSQKRQVFYDLASFELSAAGCRNATDQEFIYAAIQSWYGSLDAFTAYVRGPLRDELLADHLGTSLPWNYTLLIATPWITLGMDALAAQVRAGASFHHLVSYGSGVTLGLFGFWWIAVVQFVMLLAGRFPMPKKGRWGLVQSLVLYLLCVASIFSGAIIGHWAYKASLAASLAWCAVSGMLACLSGGLKIFKSAFGRS